MASRSLLLQRRLERLDLAAQLVLRRQRLQHLPRGPERARRPAGVGGRGGGVEARAGLVLRGGADRILGGAPALAAARLVRAVGAEDEAEVVRRPPLLRREL